MTSYAFIGAGWAFPMHTKASGGISLATGEREIEEAIRLILSTAPGERPMRPEFGCGVHDLAFDQMNPTTAGRVRFEVMTALDRWEPRIEVLDVVVTADEEDTATLLIEIQYEIRGTNNPRNLVFPYYVIPPNESDL